MSLDGFRGVSSPIGVSTPSTHTYFAVNLVEIKGIYFWGSAWDFSATSRSVTLFYRTVQRCETEISGSEKCLPLAGSQPILSAV